MANKLTLSNILPEGLNNRDFQRFDPKRISGPHQMPILFVPNLKKAEDGEKATTVQLTIANARKSVPVFGGGNTEDILLLILRHDGFIKHKKYRQHFDEDTRTLNGARARLALLNEGQDGYEAAKDAVTALEARLNNYVEDSFMMMEQLLSEGLVPEWQKVTREVCDSTTYVDLNGVEHANVAARGKNWDTLKICYYEILKWHVRPNAAELLRAYLTTCVRMAYTGVTVKQYIGRVLQLNEYLSMLPCLKHCKDSPAGMPHANVKLTELELCPIILSGIPTSLSLPYWANKGLFHFAIEVGPLVDELEAIEPQVAASKELSNKKDNSKDNGGKPAAKKGGNGKGYAKKKDNRIPRKSDDSRSSKRQKKHCDKCAKFSPATAGTHNTSDCFKWNDDGSRRGGGGGGNTTNYAEMFTAFQALQSLQKKSEKESKKKKRKQVSSDDESYDSS